MKILFSAAILFFCSLAVCAQNYRPPVFEDAARKQKLLATTARLDSLFQRYADKNNFPSVAFGLVVDDELTHEYYSGMINLEQKIPASRLSDYHIASMTKSITAMAIVQLRDAGKLSLDDPVDKFIAAAKNMKALTTDAPSITVRDLMVHAAGFPEDNPWGDRQLGRSDAWLDSLYAAGLSFSRSPATGYEYSNLGYATLGMIIKAVSGQTYQDYITEHIFKPLGMNNTYWDYQDVPSRQLAIGYRFVDGRYIAQPLLHSGSFGAMGGLITTIEDFSKYMRLHLNAWPPRDGDDPGPIKRSSVREMHYPWNFAKVWTGENNAYGKDCDIVDFYGYGLHEYINCEGLRIITHSGGLPGFGSQWRILPDHGIGLVVFANRTYAPMGALLTAAVDSLIVWTDLQPRVLPSSAILEKRKEQLVALLPSWSDAENAHIFADNFFDDYFLSALRTESEDLYRRIGKVISISKVRPENQLRGQFTIKGEKGDAKIWFSLSPEPDPKIQAFRILKQ